MKERREHDVLFELCDADLKLVEKNMHDKDIRKQLLLFHLQQAVEKFLKALLSFKNIKFPKVHDIEDLIELCSEKGILLPEYVEDFVNLTPYAVEFRYGLMIEEVLDIKLYYQRVVDFKRLVADALYEI